MNYKEALAMLQHWRAEGIEGYLVKFGGEYYACVLPKEVL